MFIVICKITNMPSYHMPIITFNLNAIHTLEINPFTRRHEAITLFLIGTISNFHTIFTPLALCPIDQQLRQVVFENCLTQMMILHCGV